MMLQVTLKMILLDAVFFTSCSSIMFYLPGGKVYKMSLDCDGETNLLYFSKMSSTSQPAHVLLPDTDMREKFFVFPCLHPPLDIELIRLCFCSLLFQC